MAILASAAAAQSGATRFIQGSWVNVRAQPEPTAAVIDQWPANTPVQLVRESGPWCEVQRGAKASGTGFVACRFLAPAPLTLAAAGKDAARAFWAAPSPLRLRDYGNALERPPALRLEALKKTHQASDVVRFPLRPEFEAAKQLLAAGVLLQPDEELQRGKPVDPAQVLRGLAALWLAPVQPSLWKRHADAALVHETYADALAGVARVRIAVQPTAAPIAMFNRHMGPEIEYVTGFWDVGAAQLQLEPPLTIYSITAQGLVAAQQVRKMAWPIGNEDFYCGARYQGPAFEWADSEAMPLKGYARLTETLPSLVSFVTAVPLPPQAVKVRAQRYPQSWVSKSYDETNRTVRTATVSYEIDLDGDGVADLLRVETPHPGDMSGEPVFDAYWFINIAGRWYAAGQRTDMECT